MGNDFLSISSRFCWLMMIDVYPLLSMLLMMKLSSHTLNSNRLAVHLISNVLAIVPSSATYTICSYVNFFPSYACFDLDPRSLYPPDIPALFLILSSGILLASPNSISMLNLTYKITKWDFNRQTVMRLKK